MLRALAIAASLLSAPVLAAAQEADHAGAEHVFVRITSGSLAPPVQSLRRDQAVGWLNYSNRIARVSFDREVGKKLVCRAPGGFRLTGERVESGNIEVNGFASLCQLAPGEYEYRVELREGLGLGGTAAPAARTGRLIVQ